MKRYCPLHYVFLMFMSISDFLLCSAFSFFKFFLISFP